MPNHVISKVLHMEFGGVGAFVSDCRVDVVWYKGPKVVSRPDFKLVKKNFMTKIYNSSLIREHGMIVDIHLRLRRWD